jgi:Flp pilus assembly pilin Flp
MRDRVKKGSAIAQYAIIIALIALALTPVFILMGNHLCQYFEAFTKQMTDNNSKIVTTTPAIAPNAPPPPTAGSNNGTPENPVKDCVNGNCSIDFGSFVLTGIPENFGEYVFNSGNSGGTDKIAGLITQLATQLEADGKPEQAEKVKELASIGHNIAIIEKQFENSFNTCAGDINCVKSKIYEPTDLNGLIDTTYMTLPFDQLSDMWEISIGVSRFRELNVPVAYEAGLNNGEPNFIFVNKFDSLMADPALTDAHKAVIKELYWEIGKISEEVESGVYYAMEGEYSRDSIDPITGITTPNESLPVDPFGIYKDYKSSSVTHIDSALICASANAKDTGTQCH